MTASTEILGLLKHIAQEQHPRREYMSPIAFEKLHRSIQQRLPAVCQIVTETSTGPKANGTAFLIGPDLLMTNRHVLSTLEAAEKSCAIFFKFLAQESSEETINLTLNKVDLQPHKERGGYFLTGSSSPNKKKLDYTIVAIKPNEETRKVEKCAFSLFQARAPREGEKIFILHHPDVVDTTTMIRGAIMISSGVIQSLQTEDETHYNVDTAPGSSGGPVVDIDGQIVDLHYAGGGSCNCSVNNHTCNAGIPIGSILGHIPPLELIEINRRCSTSSSSLVSLSKESKKEKKLKKDKKKEKLNQRPNIKIKGNVGQYANSDIKNKGSFNFNL